MNNIIGKLYRHKQHNAEYWVITQKFVAAGTGRPSLKLRLTSSSSRLGTAATGITHIYEDCLHHEYEEI